MEPSELAHYQAHDYFSSPGKYAACLEPLPQDLPTLHHALNGLLIHVWKVRKHHPEWLKERSHDVFTRRMENLLESILSLDDKPLNVARPKERRAIVDCRSFALLLCTVLRSRGIAARARCGFATYLEPTHYQDHWVCEYWNGERWVMEDPDLQKSDVSPEEFINGARAWQMCREEPALAERFGFSTLERDRGLWTVRLDHVLDFAALCGDVSVSGDGWGLATAKELGSDDLEHLDTAAELAEKGSLEARQRFYEAQPGLRMPEQINFWDYVAEEARTVNWREVR